MMSKQYFGSKMNESRVFEQTYFFLETPLPVNKSCLVRLARMLPPLYHAVR